MLVDARKYANEVCKVVVNSYTCILHIDDRIIDLSAVLLCM